MTHHLKQLVVIKGGILQEMLERHCKVILIIGLYLLDVFSGYIEGLFHHILQGPHFVYQKQSLGLSSSYAIRICKKAMSLHFCNQ
jgi:hypothetical protein